MAIKLNPESFIAVVKRSGLVEEDQLDRLVQQIRERGSEATDSEVLAESLVEQRVLTEWQAEKLLLGKYKGFVLGKYRLQALLGKGGMSSVYLAEHKVMRRRCAIKVLPTKRVQDSSYLDRFHREAQAVASLDHPNIVRAYDVDHQKEGDSDVHFLVMEYVDGPSLQEYVQKHGKVGFLDAADFIRQGALGLEHAHKNGIVHRDIKPGNLLVDKNGTVKLLDLGLARFFQDDASTETALTIRHDEKVLGTADYLAPEQAIDSHTVDERADIYSLGCTLYFLLTGQPPFNTGTLAQRLLAHQTREPESVRQIRPDLPESLEAILKKMTAKNRDDRYQSAREAADALDAWIQQNADPKWLETHPQYRTVGDSSVVAPPREAASRKDKPPTVPVAKPVSPPGSAGQQRPAGARPVRAPVASTGGGTSTAVESDVATDSQVDDDAATRTSFPRDDVSAPAEAMPADTSERETDDSPFPDFSVVDRQPGANGTDDSLAISDSGTHPGSAARRSRTSSRRRSSSDNSKMLAIVAGGGVALLLVVGLILFGGDSGDPPTDDTPPAATAEGSGESADGEDVAAAAGREGTAAAWTKREVHVGPGQEYKSLQAALSDVARHYQPRSRRDEFKVILDSGASFAERLRIANTLESPFPPGVTIRCEGDEPATLNPSGSEPVIEIGDVERLRIEGVDIAANGRPVAVKLSGWTKGVTLSQLRIRGIGKTGILCQGAAGFSGSALAEEVYLDQITFAEASADSIGVEITKSPERDSANVVVSQCRFMGPMQAGVVISGETPNDMHIRRSIFYQTRIGVHFKGQGRWKNATVVNNTFHQVDRGIVFDNMPEPGSDGIGFQRNLFVEQRGPELIVNQDYNERTFFASVNANGAGIEHNWSDREADLAAEKAVVFTANQGRQGARNLGLRSLSPDSPDYLSPGPDSPLRVGNPREGQQPYVGAVAP